MKWVWTWSGRSFGYLDGNDLWTYLGRHVGRRADSDIYSPTGRYLGEVMNNGRLAMNKARAADRGPGFTRLPSREATQPLLDAAGQPAYPGYQDFPPLENL